MYTIRLYLKKNLWGRCGPCLCLPSITWAVYGEFLQLTRCRTNIWALIMRSVWESAKGVRGSCEESSFFLTGSWWRISQWGGVIWTHFLVSWHNSWFLEWKRGEQMRKRVFCPVLIQSDLRSSTGQTQRVRSGRPGRRSEQQTGTIAGSRRAAAVLKALVPGSLEHQLNILSQNSFFFLLLLPLTLLVDFYQQHSIWTRSPAPIFSHNLSNLWTAWQNVIRIFSVLWKYYVWRH